MSEIREKSSLSKEIEGIKKKQMGNLGNLEGKMQ